MKLIPIASMVLVSFVLAGCATSTVDSRITERSSAFEKLSPEYKEYVKNGQVHVGMGPDAVYMAWGPPSQVTSSGDATGVQTTWQYHGTWMKESRFWTYREVSEDGTRFLERYLERDYNPKDYVRAEIVFRDNRVVRWRTLPKPLD
ncbi:MAG: YgdI/YgdR family lipoprotein [Verrucomicrobia bacterium]|nr:YgdI/YgdR family lipoprotein [Verrucomicrobiota bacterium]